MPAHISARSDVWMARWKRTRFILPPSRLLVVCCRFVNDRLGIAYSLNLWSCQGIIPDETRCGLLVLRHDHPFVHQSIRLSSVLIGFITLHGINPAQNGTFWC